jgi:hypothetical protein
MLTIDIRAFLCHSLKAVRQIQCPRGISGGREQGRRKLERN